MQGFPKAVPARKEVSRVTLEDRVKKLEKTVDDLKRNVDELKRELERVKVNVGLGGRLNPPR